MNNHEMFMEVVKDILKSAAFGLLVALVFVFTIMGLASAFKDNPSDAQAKVSIPNISEPLQPIEPTGAATAGAGNADVLVLKDRNTVIFRGVVTPQKVAEIQIQLMVRAEGLAKDEVIYLVLDTPGGDIESGNQLIDTVRALPQKVKTVTVFAASMGFQFVQNMDERLILPSGVLMSHRARMGIQGEVPGELLTRLNFFMNIIHALDVQAANRMGMSTEKYKELIRDEYWVNGQRAVKDRAADRLVVARCDKSLSGTTKEFLGEIFGFKVFGQMSRCPLITGILGVEVEGENEERQAEVIEAMMLYQKNRTAFVREYL